VLIYFIHHASTSIHAWHIIREISDELEENINYLFSEKLGDQRSIHNQWWISEIRQGFEQESYSILADGSGYISSIDYKSLMAIAKSKNLLLRIEKRPGKFIVYGSELLKAYPKENINGKLVQQINTFANL